MTFPKHFTDLVGTVWYFWGPSGPVSFGKAKEYCDTSLCLCFCLLVDNDMIKGLQQEKSYYSQCFIHPPSSTTISSYWVTPQNTNKTLSSDHQAPTYTPNPTALLVSPFLLLNYPNPP